MQIQVGVTVIKHRPPVEEQFVHFNWVSAGILFQQYRQNSNIFASDKLSSERVQMQNSMILPLREHVQSRKFGGMPRKWRLIYSKDENNVRIKPTKDWGKLASRAQFLDKNESNPRICILFKRICLGKYISLQ